MAYVASRKKLPSDRGFTELANLSEPLQLKLLNDMLMHLFAFLGYGLTDEGEWMAGGVSGGGGEITGDDIDITVKDFYMADVDNSTSEVDMVLAPSGIGVATMYAQQFLQAGRLMVLPHGDYVLYVSGSSAMTYGKILPASEVAGDDNTKWYKSIQAAIDSLPRVIDGDVTVRVNSQAAGAYGEPIVLNGFSGAGTLRIEGTYYAAGLYVSNCSCGIVVNGLRAAPQNAASILWHKNLNMQGVVHVVNSALRLESSILQGPSLAYGVYVDNGSVYLMEVIVNSFQTVAGGMYADIRFNTCSGSGNTTVTENYNATLRVYNYNFVPASSNPLYNQNPILIYPPASYNPPINDAYQLALYLTNVVYPSLSMLTGVLNDSVYWPQREGRTNYTFISGDNRVASNSAISKTAAMSRTVFNASATGTWLGESWTGTKQNVYQGKNATGNIVLGRIKFPPVTWSGTLRMARLRLTRLPIAGNPWPIPVYLVGLTGGDDEEPTVTVDYGVIAQPAWGERRYYDIPTAALDALRNGTISALGIYHDKALTCGFYGVDNAAEAPQLVLYHG